MLCWSVLHSCHPLTFELTLSRSSQVSSTSVQTRRVDALLAPSLTLRPSFSLLVQVPKIKGTHNAMKSGILAGEAAFEQLSLDSTSAADLSSYETAVKDSWIWDELKEVRNLRPSFHGPLGNLGGMVYSGVDSLILRGRVPWTFRNKVEDFETTKKAR